MTACCLPPAACCLLRFNFYRIVQESVNNIVKHAQATEAGIAIRWNDGRLQLTVSDNSKKQEAEGRV